MFKRILISFTLLMVSTLGLAAPAQAHHNDPTYFWNNCAPTLEIRLMDTTNWPSVQRSAIYDAAARWNDHRDACDPVLWFDVANDNFVTWDGCDTVGDIVFQRVGGNYLGDPAMADTLVLVATQAACLNGTNTRMIKQTRIMFEDPNDAYYGSSIPEPAGDRGMRGIFAHELAHALGFTGQGGDTHWDGGSDHPSWCDQNSPQLQYRTMCSSPWNSKENYMLTLHADDVSWYNNNYTN